MVSRDAVVAAASRLLEEGGLEAVTMRALARRLGIDPMAPYHYFESRDEILHEAAARRWATLRPARAAGWRARLRALATAYLRLLAGSGELLRYVTARRSAVPLPVAAFDAHFRAAVVPLALRPAAHEAARGAFVDLLHGYALALPAGAGPKAIRAELDVVLAGVGALRDRRRPRGESPTSSAASSVISH